MESGGELEWSWICILYLYDCVEFREPHGNLQHSPTKLDFPNANRNICIHQKRNFTHYNLFVMIQNSHKPIVMDTSWLLTTDWIHAKTLWIITDKSKWIVYWWMVFLQVIFTKELPDLISDEKIVVPHALGIGIRLQSEHNMRSTTIRPCATNLPGNIPRKSMLHSIQTVNYTLI